MLRRVMQEEGIKGLYAGFKVTLGRNMLYNVAQWTSFPVALALLSRPVPLASSHAHGCADASGSGGDIAAELGAGFIAGVCTAMATQPLDTVNTRLQTQVELALSALRTQTLQAQAASQPLRMYSGVRDCALKVVHHEGLPALWGGLLPRSLNFGVGAAVFFVVFQVSSLAAPLCVSSLCPVRTPPCEQPWRCAPLHAWFRPHPIPIQLVSPSPCPCSDRCVLWTKWPSNVGSQKHKMHYFRMGARHRRCMTTCCFWPLAYHNNPVH